MKSNRLLVFLVVALIASSVVLGACQAAPSAGKAIELKMVDVFPDQPPGNIPVHLLMDKVREKSKGELTINLIGGPEAQPAADAPVAVQKGVIDMGRCLYGLVNSVVPGARGIYHMEISYKEFRKRAGDYVQAMFNKAGLYFLGPGVPLEQQTFLYHYTTKKRIAKPEDFAGLKIASPDPMFFPMLGALGAIPQMVALNEYFPAVQSGIVDGYNFSTEDVVGFGLHEVTKYCVDHPMVSSGSAIIINLDAWNKIPKDLQDIMIEAMVELENDYPAYYVKEVWEPARQQMKESGMEFVKFSPADAKRYVDIYRETMWATEFKDHPEIAPKLKELITK